MASYPSGEATKICFYGHSGLYQVHKYLYKGTLPCTNLPKLKNKVMLIYCCAVVLLGFGHFL